MTFIQDLKNKEMNQVLSLASAEINVLDEVQETSEELPKIDAVLNEYRANNAEKKERDAAHDKIHALQNVLSVFNTPMPI